MASEYRTFLAQQILTESLIVSYRNLSREFRIHSNEAKRLLSQFHKQQNSKKPGSVHAVYLITGFITPSTSAVSTQTEQANGEDAHMQSSPFMSSSMPQQQDDEEQLAVKTITVCREEDLQEVKARFHGKVSIHVYSLGPGTIQNLHILSECNRAAAAKCAAEDPLQAGHQYGTIQNDRVKRRTGPRPLPAQSASITGKGIPGPKASNPAAKIEAKSAKAQDRKPVQSQASSLGETKPKDEARQQKGQEKKSAPKEPRLKREHSDIFKAFAKPPAKISRENTQNSTGASRVPKAESPAPEDIPSVRDNESMEEASDDEQMEDPVPGNDEAPHSGGNTRSAREDQLRRLWDDDEAENEQTDALVVDADHQVHGETTIESSQRQGEQGLAAPAAASGGRRRGRRKVMKKKMLKDDEGYLVTKEEPAWESFSEDEPAPKESTPASTVSSVTKGKKATGKPGQGNIMSFFGKR